MSGKLMVSSDNQNPVIATGNELMKYKYEGRFYSPVTFTLLNI